MKKKSFTFVFKPSRSGRSAEEVIEKLVNMTIQQVFLRNELGHLNNYNHTERNHSS